MQSPARPDGRGAHGTPVGRSPAPGEPTMRMVPVGTRALLVELATTDAVDRLYAEAQRRRETCGLPAVDVVPGARTVLFDGLADPEGFAAEVSTWQPPAREAGQEESLVEVPTVYDGPDLEDVASHWGMPVSEVVAVHAAARYRVAFSGFAPGFAYITGLPSELAVPRRSSPRPSVPAGSVALAGTFTGVYPRPSPGGWQLVGRTDLSLWDPRCNPPALLTPGTHVRFVPVAP